MGVSKNSGTPKSSILIGFSLINHPFWGTTIFGNTHISWYGHPISPTFLEKQDFAITVLHEGWNSFPGYLNDVGDPTCDFHMLKWRYKYMHVYYMIYIYALCVECWHTPYFRIIYNILVRPYVYSYCSSPPCLSQGIWSQSYLQKKLLVWTNKHQKHQKHPAKSQEIVDFPWHRDRKAPWVDVKPMGLWAP